MPASDARDIVRTAESGEPSPNEVSGYYKRDPDDARAYAKPLEWVDPVDPHSLDPDAHRAVVAYDERGVDAPLSVPLADLVS